MVWYHSSTIPLPPPRQREAEARDNDLAMRAEGQTVSGAVIDVEACRSFLVAFSILPFDRLTLYAIEFNLLVQGYLDRFLKQTNRQFVRNLGQSKWAPRR